MVAGRRRADRALKSNFGYVGATIHKSEQPCTSAGTRAQVRSSLYRDQAPPSDRFQGTRNMGITSLASIDLHRSAQENALMQKYDPGKPAIMASNHARQECRYAL